MDEYNDRMNETNTPIPPNRDQAFWAMMGHLSGLFLYIIPIVNVAIAIVIWHGKKDEHPFVEYHTREAVNFQISIAIYMIVAGILSIILVGLLMLFFLVMFNLIVCIIAALRARDGHYYEYPLTIRFLN